MYIKDYHYPLHQVEMRKDFRDMISKTVQNYPDKKSFLEKEGKYFEGITFTDFEKKIKYLGEGLLQSNINQRDKIAIIGKNCRQWAISYLGITTSNFIIVPIDKELKQREITNILLKSEAKTIICDNKNLPIIEKINDANKNLDKIITFFKNENNYDTVDDIIEIGEKTLNSNEDIYNSINLNPEDVTSIIFTSGTTGKAKGVMLSQKNIITNIVQMRQVFLIKPEDTFLSFLPLHHAYECTCGFLCQVHAGSRIAYSQSLKQLANNIAEAQTTIMLGVPILFETFYKRIKKAAFSDFKGKTTFAIAKTICKFSEMVFGKNIRRKVFKSLHDKFGGYLHTFIGGAAAMKPEVSNFFETVGIHAIQGYGITECSPLLAVNREKKNKHAAAGMVPQWIDVEILDKNEKGIGEVAVKGPNIMLGYYNEPELTKEAFTDDGYFLTGDYGYMDKDNFLYIAGRKKDVIVTQNGKNIFPDEVESLYVNSSTIKEIVLKEGKDPKTNDEAIIAIIHPDFESLNEILGISEDNLLNDPKIYLDKIINEIKENNKKLSYYKYIRYIGISNNEFEKTTTRKIKRFKIDIPEDLYSVY